MNAKYLIIIAGPTAVGKTSLAINLAKNFKTEILGADSRQVYREMIIGTAVPSTNQLAEIKHHFIGHKSVCDYYNAGMYELEAIELLEKKFSVYDVVILAGGSGMYIEAVCKGIDEFPTVDPEIRERLRNEYKLEGIKGIRSKLQQSDPEYYKKVDLNNPLRILKALEIIEMTGKPYSSFLTGKSKSRGFNTIRIGIDLPRKEIHDRINRRVDEMVKQGLVEEVQNIYAYRHYNALNTVGYKELFDFIDGKCTLQEAVELIKTHTRQYARRQLTWFRRDRDMHWFKPYEEDTILAYINSKIV
jgi:tRNA dimethylallyltransferase